MPAIPKKLLRSLPTLTEVVTVPVLSDHAAQNADAPSTETMTYAGTDNDTDAIIDGVMLRLDLSLQTHVQAVIEKLVQEHIREIEPRLKQKVTVAVRQAVPRR
jgi:hypothetical protein